MTLPQNIITKIHDFKSNHSDSETKLFISNLLKVKRTQSGNYFRWLFGSKQLIKKEKTPKGTKLPTLKFNANTGVAESVGPDVKTLDELLSVCKVDLNEWRVEKYVINKWAVARSNKSSNLEFDSGTITGHSSDDGKMHVQPLYQVKASLVRRQEQKDASFILEFLKKTLLEAPQKEFTNKPIVSSNERKFLYEIAMPDIHLGKLAWGEETGGENYDSNITVQLVKRAVAKLISYQNMNLVEKILLPIGNDFFNVDNSKNTTTAGTPQHEDSRWQNSFVKGAKLMTEIIEYLIQFAPVDVVIVGGNHDHERSFYLGEYLNAWFKNCNLVSIDNSPKQRKYYKWNKVLLGMTHGNEEKRNELPLIMATESPIDWAECTVYKGFQLGHFHREKLEDIKGVSIHTLPSLSAADSWHSSKGYIGNNRNAIGLLFDKSDGLIASYYFNADRHSA